MQGPQAISTTISSCCNKDSASVVFFIIISLKGSDLFNNHLKFSAFYFDEVLIQFVQLTKNIISKCMYFEFFF